MDKDSDSPDNQCNDYECRNPNRADGQPDRTGAVIVVPARPFTPHFEIRLHALQEGCDPLDIG
jgi:hypothetical protein